VAPGVVASEVAGAEEEVDVEAGVEVELGAEAAEAIDDAPLLATPVVEVDVERAGALAECCNWVCCCCCGCILDPVAVVAVAIMLKPPLWVCKNFVKAPFCFSRQRIYYFMSAGAFLTLKHTSYVLRVY
jgi:hypothetical protein